MGTSNRLPAALSGDSFFSSKKNMVGMGLATAVVGAHVVVGLGFLWPVVAAAAWGAGVLLTPAPRQKALPANTSPLLPPGKQLDQKLYKVLQPLYRVEPPESVHLQAIELEETLRFVLHEWDDLEAAPQHQQTIWNIVNIYLPEVIATYLDAPQYRSPEAADVVTGSLTTLTNAAEKVKQGILDQNLRALDSQARALREAFGDLPGLDEN
ncbi:hypothetical protein QP968_02655 [Corynebacterium sp. MSK041]|uniref:hypothetical protein n=1 Tax=Corynebacterium sp. MSK041 TaxID=3050194 RepID=UPI00254D5F95|nr:hypothetical protein [Corynebacterium sp. MSK041]MDK8794612.1 hypothetical protein [Corynebacterium sp. MSK041]